AGRGRLGMRIGIGALVGIRGGPATYARELVAALARLGGHRYVVFTDRPDDFAALDVERVHVPLPTTYHQATWDHLRLPGLVGAERVALSHGTKNILPWRLSVPGIVTVHDLAVYACPETFAWPQRLHFRLCVPPSVARAARVIADSEHARDDLVRRFRLPPERVPVVSLAVPAGLPPPPAPPPAAGFPPPHGLRGRRRPRGRPHPAPQARRARDHRVRAGAGRGARLGAGHRRTAATRLRAAVVARPAGGRALARRARRRRAVRALRRGRDRRQRVRVRGLRPDRA